MLSILRNEEETIHSPLNICWRFVDLTMFACSWPKQIDNLFVRPVAESWIMEKIHRSKFESFILCFVFLDALHSYFGVCGLSLMKEPGLLSVYPSLNISQRAATHLHHLHKTLLNSWTQFISAISTVLSSIQIVRVKIWNHQFGNKKANEICWIAESLYDCRFMVVRIVGLW